MATKKLHFLLIIRFLVIQSSISDTSAYPSESLPVPEDEKLSTLSDFVTQEPDTTETAYISGLDAEETREFEVTVTTTPDPVVEDMGFTASDKKIEGYLQRTPQREETYNDHGDVIIDNASVSESEPDSQTDGKPVEENCPDSDLSDDVTNGTTTDVPLSITGLSAGGESKDITNVDDVEFEITTENVTETVEPTAVTGSGDGEETTEVSATAGKTKPTRDAELDITTTPTTIANDTDVEDPSVSTKDRINMSDPREMDGQVEHYIIHGGSYAVLAASMDNLALTATKQAYTGSGLVPGKIKLEEFSRESNQIFDALELVTDNESLYWMISAKYALNQLGIHKVNGSEIPQTHMVKFIPVPKGEYRTAFMIKSHVESRCLQHQGEHKQVAYVPCDPKAANQQFWMELLHQDRRIIK